MEYPNISPSASTSSIKSHDSNDGNSPLYYKEDSCEKKGFTPLACKIYRFLEKLLEKTLRKMNNSEFRGFARYLQATCLNHLTINYVPGSTLTEGQIKWIKDNSNFDKITTCYRQQFIDLIEEGGKRDLKRFYRYHRIDNYLTAHENYYLRQFMRIRKKSRLDLNIFKALRAAALIHEYSQWMTKKQKACMKAHMDKFIEENRKELCKATKTYLARQVKEAPLEADELLGLNWKIYHTMRNFADVLQEVSDSTLV